MSKRVPVIVQLDIEDLQLLEGVRRIVGATRADVIRWAIRHYAICGPWPLGDPDARGEVVQRGRRYVTGPAIGEVIG